MTLATVIPRRIAAFVLATLLALGASLVLPGLAVADGCGSQDHTRGQYPWNWEVHYYQYHWSSGNSRFVRWEEVWANERRITDTWCGCINPYKPCYR